MNIEINGRIYEAHLNILGEVEVFDDEGRHASPDVYAEIDEWEIVQELLEPAEAAPPRNAAVAEPLRSIVNAFSSGIPPLRPIAVEVARLTAEEFVRKTG